VADQIKVIGARDVQDSTVQLAQRRHDACINAAPTQRKSE
jgi:hypothetical protein